jgi:hypothetical protein
MPPLAAGCSVAQALTGAAVAVGGTRGAAGDTHWKRPSTLSDSCCTRQGAMVTPPESCRCMAPTSCCWLEMAQGAGGSGVGPVITL